jgi:hypothetical protein
VANYQVRQVLHPKTGLHRSVQVVHIESGILAQGGTDAFIELSHLRTHVTPVEN